jgi:ADP-heptose:LPS heptosyltransferase
MIPNFRSRKHRRLIHIADAARDCKNYHTAALLYEKALRLVPSNAAIHTQCGHMFKEAGDLASAEPHYLQAKQLTPDDPDLALQLGHFYKVAGRLQEAELSYKQAMKLDPAWPEPAIQLAILYRAGWRNETKANDNGLVPELSPLPPEGKFCYYKEGIVVRSLGRRERTRWGIRNTIRGVTAIRGFCISPTSAMELHATLDGHQFYSGALLRFPLKEKYDRNQSKYVFNIWHDFSQFAEGLYNLKLQFYNENGSLGIYAEQIAICTPHPEDQYPSSDGLVSVSAANHQSLEEEINSRPSMVRPAKRTQFATPPRTVLIQRVDQLGDMVVSVRAVRRLKELLPRARLVGLLSPANAELANTLNLFDEVILVDFPDDEWERRRVMTLEQQDELRRRLEPLKFDAAIDLAEDNVSRSLLLLSGARFLFGFKDDNSPWLSAWYEGHARDPVNGLEEISHSARLLGLVEWFGALIGERSEIVRRDDLPKDRLVPYGLSADPFVVLHTGARLRFSRWPYYVELAAMILDKTDLKVVMMSDDPRMRSKLAPELAVSSRFQLLDKRLPFDDFDALLSFCTVFVGNDSGPSHLASLRGANVISIHLNRHNWNEWGHENNGYIITRRVPCAGCSIHHDPEECGKGFACIVNIMPEEVFRSVMEFVQRQDLQPTPFTRNCCF